MFKLLRNRKGVTLVEVLAVIVILGIIAAIAVPTIGNLIENQRENAAETEWANVLDAARLYATSEGLESGDTFDIEDLTTDTTDSGSYITIDFSKYTSDGETELVKSNLIFDHNGDIDSTTTTDVFINDVQVYTAP